ncbi:dTMP kinase [bacterium]|nr:MAG: dTMP kinase [bacterium]
MKRGIFITFEGIDGCGKSTQSERLANFLIERGVDVITTREPGGTPVAEQIRKILLDRNYAEISPRTELFLYLASRAQHTYEIIAPALESGKWVISDRFFDSSVAYQGFARGLGMKQVLEMSLMATGGLAPDLTFFLDISPEQASLRMKKQGKILDRLESEREEFMSKVREGYLLIARDNPERFIKIDGSNSPDVVWSDVKKFFLKKYPELVKNLQFAK